MRSKPSAAKVMPLAAKVERRRAVRICFFILGGSVWGLNVDYGAHVTQINSIKKLRVAMVDIDEADS